MPITTSALESSIHTAASALSNSSAFSDFAASAIGIDAVNNGVAKTYSTLSAFPAGPAGLVATATDTGITYCYLNGSWQSLTAPISNTLNNSTTSYASAYLVNSIYKQALTAATIIGEEATGSMFACGYSGFLGLGPEFNGYISTLEPCQISNGRAVGFKQIVGSTYNPIAIDGANSLATTGPSWYNLSGPVGYTAYFNEFDSQINYTLNYTAKSVSASFQHAAMISDTGYLWTWGGNNSYQLGIQNLNPQNYPTIVYVSSENQWDSGLTNQPDSAAGVFFNTVSCGYNATLAVSTTGQLWGAGNNFSGILTQSGTSPESDHYWKEFFPSSTAGTGWSNAVIGYAAGVGIKTDGSLWAWGDNYNGTLGQNTNQSFFQSGEYYPPQSVMSGSWSQIAIGWNQASYPWQFGDSVFAIRNDGTLWAWGNNNTGQLGLGDTNNRSTPTQVGNLTNWKQVVSSSGGHTVAVKTDGTLWAWGRNDSGQLGQGSTGTPTSSPVQLGTATNWRTAGVGNQTTYAIKY